LDGAFIGGLAGLVGLGGGEFRLPVLMYIVGYPARTAVPLNLAVRSAGHDQVENAGEKKDEEICCIANRDFRVRRIGSGKDQLLPQLRTLPRLH